MAYSGDAAMVRLLVRHAVSADMIAGSGLRSGDANISTVAPYASSMSASPASFCFPMIRSR